MGARIHLVCGTDDFLVEQQAKAIVAATVPEDRRAFGLEIVDGRVESVDAATEAIRTCIASVQTVGLFGGSKLTWLRLASFLNPLVRPGDNGDVKERLAELTALIKAGLSDGQGLLVTALSVARNTAFFKACQAAGEVSDFGGGEKAHVQEKLAGERLAGLLQKINLHMDPDVRAHFLGRTGTGMRTIVQELDKLSLYLGKERRAATADDVDAIVSVSREAEAWDLLDALGNRKPLPLVQALRLQQAQEASPIGLIAMLESRLRDWLVLRQAQDLRWLQPGGRWSAALPAEAEAALAALPKDPRSLPGFILRKNAEQAANYSLNELRRARHILIELRVKLVSSSAPPDVLVESALLRIIQRTKTAVAAAS